MKKCKRHPNAERNAANGCKQCASEANARWRSKNPERAAEVARRSDARRPPGRQAEIRRRAAYKKQGIDVKAAEAALATHSGACECCGRTTPGWKRGWCVDHDHATGKVRGVLCNMCNVAIGQLGDTLENVKKAVQYLEKGAVK